jgi:hypothetical protein
MGSSISGHAGGPHSRILKVFLFLLLVIAATEFVVRGPMRFLTTPGTWNDLSQNYVASKIWLAGENPCDPNNFIRVWIKEGQSRLQPSDVRTHLAPPLGVLVLLAPIAALPWPAAKVLWLTILLSIFVLALWSLFRVAQFRIEEPRALGFLAGSLALAPFHTGFASGNSSALAIGLSVIAIWSASVPRDITAGLLLGLASSLKPQIGALYVLYYLLQRRWKIFFYAAGLTTVLAAAAAISLQLHDPSWSHDYTNNAKGFVTADTIDDFQASNPIRFTLINLQVPFYVFTGSRAAANMLALFLGAILACIWLFGVSRNSSERPTLLDLGAISVLGLLPVYHRFYDAAVLVVPLCWCLTVLKGKLKNVAIPALILMTPFLFPGTAWLQLLALHGKINNEVTHAWWWNQLVMPHEVWSLLFLSVVLLYGVILYRSANLDPVEQIR